MELKMPGKIWNGTLKSHLSWSQKHLGQKSRAASEARRLAEMRMGCMYYSRGNLDSGGFEVAGGDRRLEPGAHPMQYDSASRA